MSRLKEIRVAANLTQEELAADSGISIRTIQRIEAGTEPKGHTLRSLARALKKQEAELLKPKPVATAPAQNTFHKIVNIASLPVAVFPPLNILVPLLIVVSGRKFNPVTKQIISLQILWTVAAAILFMLSSFIKNWFALGNKFILIVMIILGLSNIFIILKNAVSLDRKQSLHFKLNFSII